MMYAHVVFPLKLPPLTYRLSPPCPEDPVGTIVRAPLHGRLMTGVVTEVIDEVRLAADFRGTKKEVKSVVSVHGRFGGEAAMRLMAWLSDYYLAPAGLVLKSMFFNETLSFLSEGDSCGIHRSERELRRYRPGEHSEPATVALTGSLSAVADCITRRVYRSFLFNALSPDDEYRFVAEVLSAVRASFRGVIVLVPEIARIEPLSAALGDIARERLAILHSRLSRAKRLDAIRRILSRESDIVIGTRSAVLAPLREVSLIAAVSEHSPSYKAEEGMKYHGRDVAVMRGSLECAPVILSSMSPSLESMYNAMTNKYSLLRVPPCPEGALSTCSGTTPQTDASPATPVASVRPRPVVIVVKRPRRHEPLLSREVLHRAKRILSSGEELLFLASRRGYSFLSCEECGHVALCGACRVPLVFHKTLGVTRCQCCRKEELPPDRCSRCGGFQLVPLKSGTEKVKEFLEETLGIGARLIERSRASALGSLDAADTHLVTALVGTAQATRRLSEGSLGAVVFTDIDTLLSRPHFRASERTFQEVLQASRLVRPGGTVFLQTAVHTLPIFRFLRNFDYQGFAKEELIQRKAIGYPPYSRIILVTVSSKRVFGGELKKLFAAEGHAAVERLGPVEKDPPLRPYRQTFQMVLKSSRREELHAAARDLSAAFGTLKGVKVSVDVDPSEI